MKNLSFVLLCCFVIFSACSSDAQLKLQEAFPNITIAQPVGIENAGDGSNRMFVLSQQGIIYVFKNDPNVKEKEVFLDIKDKVLSGGEQGLLGLAFHPDYKKNGYFFIDYTAANPRRTIIAGYKVDPKNPNKADKNSETILEVEQPFSNHNGGQTRFGPDGYLYVSFGDGGKGGDPFGNGQNRSTILGSIIRIDVNKKSAGKEYGIPSDNPFAGNKNGYREEIYAYGLRNPWRFSFDPVTKKLWTGDVGQNKYEEIDIIEKGKDYGWNIMEGFHCYSPEQNCDETGLVKPVWEYPHDSDNNLSITGGFVYRGKTAPELTGKYIYGDFVSGRIWSFELKNGKPVNTFLVKSATLSTFGADEHNELYIANYGSGKIYKFAH